MRILPRFCALMRDLSTILLQMKRESKKAAGSIWTQGKILSLIHIFLINGLGATSVEELYILSNDVNEILTSKGIHIYKTVVGEYATSMEMAGASISICKMNDEMKHYMDYPVNTPFICQK